MNVTDEDLDALALELALCPKGTMLASVRSREVWIKESEYGLWNGVFISSRSLKPEELPKLSSQTLAGYTYGTPWALL